MDWPTSGKYIVRTLGTGDTGIAGDVKTVQLLGHGAVPFARTADGLEVTLPAEKPCDHAYVLKVTGLDLAASNPVVPMAATPTIHAAADGSYTLGPDAATLNGNVQAQGGAVPNIGYWDNARDTASWTVHFDTPGTYAITARVSAGNGDTAFVVDAGSGASTPLAVPKTASWDDYHAVTGGVLKVGAPGDHVVTVKAAAPASWHAMNLASVTLTRTGD